MNRISVIYLFKVKNGQSQKFITAWKELTSLIYKYENSLGSRLHREDEQTYVAYALWPNITIWENSGKNLPARASEVRKQMRGACEEVQLLHELEIVEDLIK